VKEDVGREVSRHFRNNKREYLKGKINELQQTLTRTPKTSIED
jgi:hypothetical protein